MTKEAALFHVAQRLGVSSAERFFILEDADSELLAAVNWRHHKLSPQLQPPTKRR